MASIPTRSARCWIGRTAATDSAAEMVSGSLALFRSSQDVSPFAIEGWRNSALAKIAQTVNSG